MMVGGSLHKAGSLQVGDFGTFYTGTAIVDVQHGEHGRRLGRSSRHFIG